MKSRDIILSVSVVLSVWLPQGRAGTTRVSCVGNSVTNGSNLDGQEDKRYPGVLQTLLGDAYVVSRNGVGGACLMKNCDLPYWKSGLPKVFEVNPHIIILMLGTNDSKTQNESLIATDFVKDMKAMIDSFGTMPASPEVWLGIPPPVFGAGCCNIQESVLKSTISPLIRQVAEERQLGLIDVRTPLENRPDLFEDGVHPTVEGYKEIAAIVYNALTGNTESRSREISDAFRSTCRRKIVLAGKGRAPAAPGSVYFDIRGRILRAGAVKAYAGVALANLNFR